MLLEPEDFKDEDGKIMWATFAAARRYENEYGSGRDKSRPTKLPEEPFVTDSMVIVAIVFVAIVLIFAIALPGHWIWYIGR